MFRQLRLLLARSCTALPEVWQSSAPKASQSQDSVAGDTHSLLLQEEADLAVHKAFQHQ